MPDFTLENEHNGPVFGIDEVGRGPLAGPVVAACVHIPANIRALPFITEIKDSKKLSDKKLYYLYTEITTHCTWATAKITPAEIDKINILQASLKAMEQAYLNASSRAQSRDLIHAPQIPPCASLSRDDHFCLVDGNKLPNLPCPAKAIVKGDSKSTSIATASIIAKVTRDRIMRNLHEEFPQYGWNTNVGYPSAAHRDAIDQHGITDHHRKSFAPVKNFLTYGTTRAPQNSAA